MLLNARQFHYLDVQVKNSVSGTSLAWHHYKAAGHPWPVYIMICSLIRGGNPWPDTNIMQMVKHNNKMASFVVKVQQPLPAQKRSIVQTMHSRSYGRKMKNSLLFTMDRVISFLVLHRRCCLRCVLSLTEGEPLQGWSVLLPANRLTPNS